MKKQHYNIVLVDDHPLITQAYESAFEDIRKTDGTDFNIITAHNYDAILHILDDTSPMNPIDMVLLDIQMPPSTDHDMISGEDLGLKIRERCPETKIVIATAYNNPLRIHSLFASLAPEGFLVKNDLTAGTLIETIRQLINAPPYYSKTVTQFLRRHTNNSSLPDKTDRQLLYHLSQGMKIKDIAGILPLSRTALEKRRRRLRDIFNIQSTEDRELILEARKKGFL